MHAFLTANCQLPTNTDTLRIHPDKSIGIEEIRQIQHFLSRKPLSDHNTVIIDGAHLLTLPAQHALLKTLEEPPGNSLIYLVTHHPDSLLPTILSRVQIQTVVIPSAVEESLSNLIRQLLSINSSKRLALLDAQSFTRDSFSAFLDQFEFNLHQEIKKNHQVTMNYELLTSTRRYLKSNCNLKLILDNFTLNLTS